MTTIAPPTAEPTSAPSAPSRSRRRPSAQRERAGMAILMVVTAIAICMVIVNEFGTRTTGDYLQARNNLDQMRAHFLARSSLNVTDLVMRLQKRIDGAPPEAGLDGVLIAPYADMLMGAFGGSPEEVESALGLPIEDAKGFGSDIGGFGVVITPIDGKINVNCAAAASPTERKLVRSALEALIYPPAFDPIFEEADSEGWRRDRKTQIDAIMDYIDTNTDRADTPGAPEDYGYEGLRDKYKAKNRPIDSVEELKLVRGVDDRFWTLFGGALRVTGACKINLRALDDQKVIALLIQLAAADPQDPALNGPIPWQIANLALQALKSGLVTFATTDEFIEFVKDPSAMLAALAADPSGAQGAAPPAIGALQPGVGIVLKKTELEKIASSKALQLYTVEVYGEVARGGILNPLRRTIRATWDQDFVLQQSRVKTKLPPGKNNGAWLYLREE